MIDHSRQTVSGDEYNALLAQMYEGQLDRFGHIPMARLREDCVSLGAPRISALGMWTDEMMVYFLAERRGLLSSPS